MSNSRLRIAALEPYAAVSHLAFLDGLTRHSVHDIRSFTLPPRYWKWRMRTASVHFAAELAKAEPFDLLLASDYLNLAELRALLPTPQRNTPCVVYFHENQLSYPLQKGESRDVHHALTHLHAILCSARAVFNSEYHRSTFLGHLELLLRRIPDVAMGASLEQVREKSCVLPIGTDLPAIAPGPESRSGGPPRILWNHRWEYDKDPERFLEALGQLDRQGVDFRLVLLGQSFRAAPNRVQELLEAIAHRIEASGFLEERGAYVEALRSSDIVCSTARHEFFGIGTLEALRCGCLPLLPDDLAYPELLPELSTETDVHRGNILYQPRASFAAALASTIDAAKRGLWMEMRQRIVEGTERFRWETLAPRYDELLATAGRSD